MQTKSAVSSSAHSLWFKNLLLSFFSLFISLVVVFASDGSSISENGFLSGYDARVWFVVFLQVVGGLLIGAVLKYAGNVSKAFATSASTVLSSVASVFLFDFDPTSLFVIGSCVVFYAVYLYNTNGGAGDEKKKEKTNEGEEEGVKLKETTVVVGTEGRRNVPQ